MQLGRGGHVLASGHEPDGGISDYGHARILSAVVQALDCRQRQAVGQGDMAEENHGRRG